MTIFDNLAGVTVEIGFNVDAVGGDFFVLDDPVKGLLDDGAGTFNTTFALAPETTFVDVTAYVASISTDRGRDREIDEYGTGIATVVFNDDDRTFDPANSASQFAGEIVPMKRIEIKRESEFLFSGWVDDWSIMYEPGDNLSRVTAECVDGFAILANQELSEIASSFSGDLSGERIRRVLNRAEIDFPATRSIDDGLSTLGATTLGGNALAYLQACSRAEAGYLFVFRTGVLGFRERTAVLNAESNATLSDDRDNGIPYLVVGQRSAADLLFTRVTGESETTGTEQVSTDATAADNFLVRTLALGTLFNSTDAEVKNLTDYHLERFSAVEERFESATINVGALTADQVQTLLSLDLTHVVTVERSPLGVGDTISRLSLIDSVRHRIAPGSWTAELSFSNADTRSFLTLDDPITGELDANRLAF